jgi:hypothetical protein
MLYMSLDPYSSQNLQKYIQHELCADDQLKNLDVNYIKLLFLQIQLNISLQTTAFYNLLTKHRDIIVFISDDRH